MYFLCSNDTDVFVHKSKTYYQLMTGVEFANDDIKFRVVKGCSDGYIRLMNHGRFLKVMPEYDNMLASVALDQCKDGMCEFQIKPWMGDCKVPGLFDCRNYCQVK